VTASIFEKNSYGVSAVSGIRRGVNEVFALLGCYFKVMCCNPE